MSQAGTWSKNFFVNPARDNSHQLLIISIVWFPNMPCMRIRSRGAERAQVMHETRSLKKEGAGKAGRRMHPQPRVQVKKAHEQVTTGSPETIRPSLRNGFNGLFRALPGEPGFFATIPA
jgi:hypothetical protein